jgi:hypothetical protein
MAAKDNLQPKLFDIPTDEPTPISMPLDETATYWHGSQEVVLPAKDRGENVPVDYEAPDRSMGHPQGIHSGTLNAALERGRETTLPVYISGKVASRRQKMEDANSAYDYLEQTGDLPDHTIWTDPEANNSIKANRAIKEGKNVAYQNDLEDFGSVSMRSPRRNVRTWSEQVIADPDNASYAERSAVRKGAELVYKPVTDWPRGSKPTGFPEGILYPPTLSVEEVEGNEKVVVPHMVYPHKKAKRSKTDTNQLELDI